MVSFDKLMLATEITSIIIIIMIVVIILGNKFIKKDKK
jgi:hypothetical protein